MQILLYKAWSGDHHAGSLLIILLKVLYKIILNIIFSSAKQILILIEEDCCWAKQIKLNKEKFEFK